LVKVFQHGEATASLFTNDLYQIDMELCLWNLWDELKDRKTSIYNILMQWNSIAEKEKGELSDLLEKEVNWAKKVIQEILGGLNFIHSLQEIHRDLKPANGILSLLWITLVLFSYIDQRWKIGDFGCTAEGTSTNLRSTSRGRGSNAYRAPELLTRQAHYHPKSDVWAFGCIVHEIITGMKAFESDYDIVEYANAPVQPSKMTLPMLTTKTNFSPRLHDILATSEACVHSCLLVDFSARLSASEHLRIWDGLS
jgi:serine/threonine protein kinase